ncbi:MAG: dephospho-CoA kinase [Chloroflexi bacterium]|nr:dephospho-CoA kinase [Chloroflexota bacterium]
MTTIGLTGGIASGKSAVAEHLKSLGAVVIDADRLGHRVYEPGSPGFQKVVNAFGHDVVAEDGTINRRVLGGKVFGDPEQMERLTDISWPEIQRLAEEEIAAYRERDPGGVIVLEAAVLIEAEWTGLVDEVWVVSTTIGRAVDRLRKRNGMSEQAARARINSQISTKERLERADVHVRNSDTPKQLESRVLYHWRRLQRRMEERRAVVAQQAAR